MYQQMGSMGIELERSPRYIGAQDDDCIWKLIVNGYCIGTYFGGKEKKYEDKYKWADKMVLKRVPVILKNIERLKSELASFENELEALRQYKVEVK